MSHSIDRVLGTLGRVDQRIRTGARTAAVVVPVALVATACVGPSGSRHEVPQPAPIIATVAPEGYYDGKVPSSGYPDYSAPGSLPMVPENEIVRPEGFGAKPVAAGIAQDGGTLRDAGLYAGTLDEGVDGAAVPPACVDEVIDLSGQEVIVVQNPGGSHTVLRNMGVGEWPCGD